MDLSLPRKGEARITGRLLGRHPNHRLIVLRVHDEPTVVGLMLSAGAADFVLKRRAAADLIPAVKEVLRVELPPDVTARVSVEQASTFGWAKYVDATGQSIGLRSFGASAPLKDLIKKFDFAPEHMAAVAREQLQLAAIAGRHGGASHDDHRTGPL